MRAGLKLVSELVSSVSWEFGLEDLGVCENLLPPFKCTAAGNCIVLHISQAGLRTNLAEQRTLP